MLIFFVSLTFYIYNLAPSITVGDAGEFITSCKILGINHAPGYPLLSILGKIFLTVIPFGDIAYRINFMSAFWGASTVWLIYTTLKIQSLNKVLSFLVSLLFMVSYSFVRSSIQTEAFTLNSFFVALIVFVLLSKFSRTNYDKDIRIASAIKYLYFISFVCGFALGNHHTLLLMVPAIFYWIYKNRIPITLPHIFNLVVFFTIGFSIYLYLPVRAVKEPGFNVGSPTTVTKVIRVIRRADYGTFQLTVGEKEKYDLKTMFLQTKRAFAGISHQFSIVGLFLLMVGIYFIWKKNRQLAIFFLLFYFFSVPFFIYLANLPFNAEAEGILDRFYVMGNIPLVFMIFYGIVLSSEILKNKLIPALLVAVAIFLTLGNNLSSYNWRNYYLAYDYGKNILKTIAPSSAFFMDGGDDTFYSTGYFVFAKKHRADIELYDRGGVVFKSPYGADFRKLSREEKEIRRKIVERDISKTKPVYFSTFNREIMSPVPVEAVGILYAPRAKNNLFHFYSLRNVFDNFNDYRSYALQPLYPYLESQFSSEPQKLINYCIARWPDVLWLKSNARFELTLLAYQKFSEGKMDEAKNLYEDILKFYPDDASAMVNLGVIYEKKGDEISALEHYQKAIQINPAYAMAYYNAAVIYWKRQDWRNVIFFFGKVLEYDPDNEQAKRYLEIARRNYGSVKF